MHCTPGSLDTPLVLSRGPAGRPVHRAAEPHVTTTPLVTAFSVGFEICAINAGQGMRCLREEEGHGPQSQHVSPQVPCRGVLLGGGTRPGGGAFPHLPRGHPGAGRLPADACTSLWPVGPRHFPPAKTPSSSFFSLACLGPFPKVRDTFRPILQLLLPPRKSAFAGCYVQNGFQGYSWGAFDRTVDKSRGCVRQISLSVC